MEFSSLSDALDLLSGVLDASPVRCFKVNMQIPDADPFYVVVVSGDKRVAISCVTERIGVSKVFGDNPRTVWSLEECSFSDNALSLKGISEGMRRPLGIYDGRADGGRYLIIVNEPVPCSWLLRFMVDGKLCSTEASALKLERELAQPNITGFSCYKVKDAADTATVIVCSGDIRKVLAYASTKLGSQYTLSDDMELVERFVLHKCELSQDEFDSLYPKDNRFRGVRHIGDTIIIDDVTLRK